MTKLVQMSTTLNLASIFEFLDLQVDFFRSLIRVPYLGFLGLWYFIFLFAWRENGKNKLCRKFLLTYYLLMSVLLCVLDEYEVLSIIISQNGLCLTAIAGHKYLSYIFLNLNLFLLSNLDHDVAKLPPLTTLLVKRQSTPKYRLRYLHYLSIVLKFRSSLTL